MRGLRTLLCLLVCVFLLAACGKQAAEDPAMTQGTTEATQPTKETYPLGAGELPPVIIPPQTQPVTDPTEATEATEPAETVQPSDPTELVDTQPQETEPAETTEPSELDDNELPPMVVG